jgi:hypothetical protein
MCSDELDTGDALPDYTAFEKWEYQQVIHSSDQHHWWRNVADSYFYACEPLVRDLAAGKLRDDIEGTAAIFLFRHYLELALKAVVYAGRLLTIENDNLVNAFKAEVKEVERIHVLATLWDWVLRDAKPHLENWDDYDTESVERCVREFDAVDPKGFAFRYQKQGAEFCCYDFRALDSQMNHIRQVLDGIKNCLFEAERELNEYEQYLNQEFGRGEYE